MSSFLASVFLSKLFAALSLLGAICSTCVTRYQIKTQKGDLPKDPYVSETLAQNYVLLPLTVLIHALYACICNRQESGHLRQQTWNYDDIVAIIIGFLGVILRAYSMRTLGKYFTFQVGIRKDHKLITCGPYQYVRHPSYTGFILANLALLYFYGIRNRWIWTLLICSSTIKAYARIVNEEKVLKQEFGDQWIKYCRSTPYVLVPGII
eukprot:TRINITY_DN5377_c0_g1_i1.p1 TRINITY_DN5377_c0_g1~~TRINITY_DN5377_c0_g1_i1.p1  ORF type:complete len:208 (-),score=-7.57 TRINITY_DN5377_c0_g1_i1:672-1295(-)